MWFKTDVGYHRSGSIQTERRIGARLLFDPLIFQIFHKVTVLSFRKSFWAPNLNLSTSSNEQSNLRQEGSWS